MRFWLSFSVSPVTSAPVLLAGCLSVKLWLLCGPPTRLPPAPADRKLAQLTVLPSSNAAAVRS